MLTLFKDRTALYILLAGTIVRIITSIIVPPGFDESYYGCYSFHPAWGYFDHPPMVMATASIGLFLTGTFTSFTLRFGALIIYIISLALVYDIANRLSDQNSARISLILGSIIPYFLIGMGAFVIPDNAFGLFMLLFIMSLVRLKETGNTKYFLLTGTWLGLAFLSKYHAVLLLGGLFFLLIFYKDWRKYLLSPYLYIGILLSVLIFSPNIYWNYEHNWVSYAYQFSKSTGVTNFSLNTFLQGVFVQGGYLLPWVMIVLIIALFRARKDPQLNWIIPFAALPIIAFTLVGATRQIMPHWPMPGYLAAILIAGVWIGKWSIGKQKLFFYSTGGVTLAALIIVNIQALTGFLPIEKTPDVTLDGQGWEEVYYKINSMRIMGDRTTFIFTHKWFLSGEFDFASGGKYNVFVFNDEAPYSYAFWDKTKDNIGKNALFITTDRFHDDPTELCKDYFTEFELLQTVPTYRGGSEAQVFEIWFCKGLKKPFPNPYSKYINE